MSSLRVRIHLNLKTPERAESAVKVQSPSGTWVTVGYAQELLLSNIVPVVHAHAQKAIARGESLKTVHAFLEGNLVHFKGRIRARAPHHLLDKARPYLKEGKGFSSDLRRAFNAQAPIGYNPRFATCFYRHNADKAAITERFLGSRRLVVRGWAFMAIAPTFSQMADSDYCPVDAIAHTSDFERKAMRQGAKETARLLVTG